MPWAGDAPPTASALRTALQPCSGDVALAAEAAAPFFKAPRRRRGAPSGRA